MILTLGATRINPFSSTYGLSGLRQLLIGSSFPLVNAFNSWGETLASAAIGTMLSQPRLCPQQSAVKKLSHC